MSDFKRNDKDDNHIHSEYEEDGHDLSLEDGHNWLLGFIIGSFLWLTTIILEYVIMGNYILANWPYSFYCEQAIFIFVVTAIVGNLIIYIAEKKDKKIRE